MRCNCGVEPKLLTDEHLFAESRELKMLPSLFNRVGYSSIKKVPKEFSLGAGHMLFFLYKPTYSLARYRLVLDECWKRGFNVPDESDRWSVYSGLVDCYAETGKERDIVVDRIAQRIIASRKECFHYNHKKITKYEAIALLK